MSEALPSSGPEAAQAPAAERREAPGFWNTVRMLGRLLGRVIERDRGHDFFERIETIRALAKAARSQGAWFDLYRYLEDIPSYEVIDVTRAFNQFLHLANIAEQDHQVAIPDDEIELIDCAGVAEVLCQTFYSYFRQCLLSLLTGRWRRQRSARAPGTSAM